MNAIILGAILGALCGEVGLAGLAELEAELTAKKKRDLRIVQMVTRGMPRASSRGRASPSIPLPTYR
jgi:hypothetical protein